MEDWTVTLRDLTFGAGTDYPILPPGISGLGMPTPRTRDTERGDLDGDVGGFDRLPRRVLTFPVGVEGSSPSDCWTKFDAFKAGWAESRIDLELALRLPGVDEFGLVFFGRPRGVTDNLAMLKSGHVDLLAIFEALDPFAYGEEIEGDPETGTFIVDNVGTAPTDRATLIVTSTGDAPRIVNNAADGADVGFSVPFTGTRTIDLRARTIVDDAGDSRFDEFDLSSRWFRLEPGENELELDGGDDVTVDFRPAFR